MGTVNLGYDCTCDCCGKKEHSKKYVPENWEEIQLFISAPFDQVSHRDLIRGILFCDECMLMARHGSPHTVEVNGLASKIKGWMNK